MIQSLLARLAAIAATIIAIFSLGNYLGKKSQKIKQFEEDFEDELEEVVLGPTGIGSTRAS